MIISVLSQTFFTTLGLKKIWVEVEVEQEKWKCGLLGTVPFQLLM